MERRNFTLTKGTTVQNGKEGTALHVRRVHATTDTSPTSTKIRMCTIILSILHYTSRISRPWNSRARRILLKLTALTTVNLDDSEKTKRFKCACIRPAVHEYLSDSRYANASSHRLMRGVQHNIG